MLGKQIILSEAFLSFLTNNFLHNFPKYRHYTTSQGIKKKKSDRLRPVVSNTKLNINIKYQHFKTTVSMVTEIIFKKRRENFPIVTRKRCKNLGKTDKCKKLEKHEDLFKFAQPVFKKRDSVRIWYARMIKNLMPTWRRLARQRLQRK